MNTGPTMISLATAASLLTAGLALLSRWDPVVRRRLQGLASPSTGSNRRSLFELIGGGLLATRLTDSNALQRLIGQSGFRTSVPQVKGWKLAGAGAGLMTTTGCAALIGSSAAFALAPLAAIVGFRAPDVVLKRRARARQASMARQIPEFAELLLTATEAGLGLHLSLTRASSFLPAPLGYELQSALSEVELGASWQEALERMTQRANVQGLSTLTRTIARSRRLGVPVASTLRGVVEELRAERRTRAEEAARRAPVKMLFPLVFLILPAFILLTVGPVFISTLRSLH